MKHAYLIALVFLFIINACKKENPVTEIDFGYSYYPSTLTFWRIYQVDSIVHDDNDDFTGKIDTFTYQIKEIITETFTDLQGDTAYRLERYIRNNDEDNWQVKDIWYFNIYPTKIEATEENIRFVKMVFPVKENKTWDGNAANANPEQTYEYQNVNMPFSVNNIQFDSTVTVLQEDYQNLIEKIFSREIYAKNIGLISKSIINIDYQAEGGLEYYQTIIDWKKD